MKANTKTVLTVCAVIAMLGAACASRYQNTPQQKFLRYLKHAEYTVIHPVSVQCGFDKNGTAVTAAEIRFAFSINESEQTDALIHDVFRARAAAERYLAEHRAELPETPVSMVFLRPILSDTGPKTSIPSAKNKKNTTSVRFMVESVVLKYDAMSGRAGIYMSVESGAMALHMVISAIIPPLPSRGWCTFISVTFSFPVMFFSFVNSVHLRGRGKRLQPT